MVPKITCLLVDDIEDNLLALSGLLRRDDVEIVCAHSGREALELLLVHDVAVAFVDVQMPEMDGFELAEVMRSSERTRRIPIIFVTAASREPSRAFRGYNAGAVDFLYKPIDPLILESKAAVFFELHRQKQLLAEELRQRTETLRLSEMFTAVLGHDLRNPLNAVLTAAFLIQGRSEDAAVLDAARRIVASGERMTHMIDNLLDLARARLAGGIPLNRTPSSLLAIAQKVVEELQPAHPARSIELQSDGDLSGEWDVDRIQQLVSNLVGNALQHGAPSCAIRIVLDGVHSDIVGLTVLNEGVIPAEVMPFIFEPFKSGEQRFGEGLGLGLYIAQQIALAHQGHISAESSDERGTSFRLAMPRRLAEFVLL